MINDWIRHDFRSDTVTRPSIGMRQAMADADVGDDYYRDDPTVLRLEQVMAELLGKEAAILTTSGTQSNLVALMCHCNRGDAYIVGDRSHSYVNELGGAAMLASIHSLVVPNQADGTLLLCDVESKLQSNEFLAAPCSALSLENTFNGLALSRGAIKSMTDAAAAHGLTVHLDGARVFNASAALGISVAEIVKSFDTVSICLSKGLGAPVGSVLVGSRPIIERARRYRQALGGGLRQAGVLAAAGLYALDTNIDRLRDDHERATRLAHLLGTLNGVSVDEPQTNMVFATIDPDLADRFSKAMKKAGIAHSGTLTKQRWVTHLDIGDQALEAVATVVDGFATRENVYA